MNPEIETTSLRRTRCGKQRRPFPLQLQLLSAALVVVAAAARGFSPWSAAFAPPQPQRGWTIRTARPIGSGHYHDGFIPGAPSRGIFDVATSKNRWLSAQRTALFAGSKEVAASKASDDSNDDNDVSSADDINSNKDSYFDVRTTWTLVGGQSVLVLISIAIAAILGTPNYGLGPNISFDTTAIEIGSLLSLPLGIVAVLLDTVEERYPALQDVTKATQRSILSLLGSKFKPLTGLVVAVALGLAAGIGEEMLFRGVAQYEIATHLGPVLAVFVSSLIFGALHAVTPLYAGLASVASVYFGMLYLASNNLAVPIACHTVYDIVALYYAHWTVSRMSAKEQMDLALWDGPSSDKK